MGSRQRTLGLLFVITAGVVLGAGRTTAQRVTSPSPVRTLDDVPLSRSRLAEKYGQLPLSFEANEGQTDSRVRFLSRGNGYTLLLTSTEAVLALRADETDRSDPQMPMALKKAASKKSRKADLRMKLLGGNPSATAMGLEQLPGKTNYFIGSNPEQWRTSVANYRKVRFAEVYRGIDLVYYGNQRQLEYDFIVAPGADLSAIELAFSGAERLEIDSHGELVGHTAAGEVRWHKPVVYQEVGGVRQMVDGRYVWKGKKSLGFQVASYDRGHPLIIDPVLVYSTYLGGTGADYAFGIAVDASGSAYITGRTTSTDFPTLNSVQASLAGVTGAGDVFVTKLNAAGTAPVYSTYLGGSGEDEGLGIAVDSAGNAYVTGDTASAGFPKVNAFQTTCSGDAFVSKLNPAGNALLYSTCLGGSGSLLEGSYQIAVDSAGNAYVAGITDSSNFPTRNAFQPTFGGPSGSTDAFVTKLNTNVSGNASLVYSTYLGGSNLDQAHAIAVDAAGNAYVTGTTFSTNFPVSSSAFQKVLAGVADVFVTKLNATGNALMYSTYLGGSVGPFGGEQGDGIAVDASGNAYVTGSTGTTTFPTLNGVQTAFGGGNSDAFVTKLNAAGSALLYSTYLGGSANDDGDGIALDSAGNVYVGGTAVSANFPTTANAVQSFGGFIDAFVAKLDPFVSGSASLLFSSYLGGSGEDNGRGGIAVDTFGNAYVTGYAGSTNFPTVSAFQPAKAGGPDAFMSKIFIEPSTPIESISVAPANPSIQLGATQQFTATRTFSGSSTDVTNTVTWSSGTPSVATITAGGFASGIGGGTSVITATLGSVSGSTTLKVINPVIDYTLSASPLSLALIASQTKSSGITLRSQNGVGGTVQLTAAWLGPAPTGTTFTLSPQQVTVPSTGSGSSTLTLTTSASPSPGTFTLRITGTTASGVTRFINLTISITGTGTLPAPTCGCTNTGPFKDPRVRRLVGSSPLATVTPAVPTLSSPLTLTRNSDNMIIVNGVNNVSAFGFSPNGKYFVLITSLSSATGPRFALTLYSIATGGTVGGGSPLVTNPLSWGFSPDSDNRYFLVTSSDSLPTHVDVEIYDTHTGTRVMQDSVTSYSSVGAPAWTDEQDVEGEDSDNNTVNDNDEVGGWGFSPDGNTFVLSYKTAANTYLLSLWSLTHNGPFGLSSEFRHDVASFWQFSPCGDLFMLVTQVGANPATSDDVIFLFTSNGQPYRQANLAPSQGDPSAEVVTKPDGSKEIQLTGMSLTSIPSPQCSTSVAIHSPANIVVIDDAGRRTGFDPASNGVVNLIPGGSYTGVESEPQTVTVPYVAGTYLIVAYGLDSLTSPQPYTLTIAARDASGDIFDQAEVVATASRGSQDTYSFILGDGPIALEVVSRDVNPPEILCASPDGQWHATDVSLACSATDGQSGLANPADAAFSLSTHVSPNTETSTAITDSRQVCDAAANCAIASPLAGNMVDEKGPSITISAPSGSYLVGQAVAASYACSDGGSGLASCTGSVSNGANVDTASAGTRSFNVAASDKVGNFSSRTVQYNVSYGVCLLYDPLKAKKSGSAYPIKVQLCGTGNLNLSSPSVVLHAVSVTRVDTSALGPLDDTGNANPDFDFRYDAALAGYIFNLSTKGMPSGTYNLNFVIGTDPAVHSVTFAVQ